MKFQELRDDSCLDLGKEVERLRLEVTMAEAGYDLPPSAGDADSKAALPSSMLAAFQSPEDFTVREQTLQYSNGDSYEGETLGSLRHGRGKHTCSSGDVYDGQWRYDKRDGRGKMTFVRGLQYDGEWKDDKAHGQGAARYENGGVYVGEFADDVRSGWGTHYFPNKDKYEGEWAADTMTGKGRLTYADGSFFEGEWQAGLRVKGRFVEADGSSEYSGGWRNDQRHGYGVLYQRNLFKYAGQWVDGLQSGEGKCQYADSTQYDGQWKAGQRHGRGKFSAGAYKYEGEWRNDKQHGSGACQTDAGDKYVGEFADSKRHGKGRCLYADGGKYEGEWQVDVRHGQGTCHFASGDKYQGAWDGLSRHMVQAGHSEWRADKRHGQGVCKFADGRKFRGDWEDDGWLQSSADPVHCRVAGPGVTRAVAGQKGELLIEARDDGGCRRLCGGDEFQVALHGPSEVVGEVTDNEDGTYSVCYTATAAGVYELHITVAGDEHVAQSPYPLRVLPARPATKRCTVEGSGRSAAVAGRPAEFAVQVCDEFGNRWSGPPEQLERLLPLEASLSSGNAELELSLEPTSDGLYRCTYTAPEPGFWRLHISCSGQPLPRTPFSVHVADPAAALEGPAAAADAAAGDAAPAAAAEGAADEGAANPADAAGTAAGGASSVPPAPPAPASAPIVDQSRLWEQIAAAAFAADGSMDGWDSDSERQAAKQSKEVEYIKANPNVPVVENLEDLWMVSRLQNEKKRKEEQEKARRLQGMRSKLEAAFGPARPPSQAEVETAVKEILQAEAEAQLRGAAATEDARAAGSTAAPTTDGSITAATAPTGAGTPAVDTASGAAASAAGSSQAPAAAAAVQVPLRGGRAGLRAAAAALSTLD
ncbi:hypothetical protein COHA_001973 [Chlorella ohadii]|uniref:Uncharacterized protein n=1 Tax=Chlorella ohadii TaxID=2649997 RepID=A0AAD5DYC1_9CHLO|nr:hypothetical protein COHA_001973 [Chlorella ohadii]